MRKGKRAHKRAVLLFAGTTEGRLLAQYLKELGWPAVVCVATEYGRDVLDQALGGACQAGPEEGMELGPEAPEIRQGASETPGRKADLLEIRQGRLELSAMEALLDEVRPGLVIDGTHPYAVEVTDHIRKACAGRKDLRLLRCLRDGSDRSGEPDRGRDGSVVHVRDVTSAVAWLSQKAGAILVTTGSKELAAYCGLPDYRQRVYPRVLPSTEAVGLCWKLGYEGRHIIAMQGPFSEEMNLAQLKEYDCRYLVTKDGGAAGGFEEKLRAAKRAGAVAVVVDRPGVGEGISLEEIKQQVKEWIDHERRQTIYG